MKRLITTILLASVATGASYAQYVNDALRFSQNDYGSSARFKAMGNAQIGVGGDISSLGGNPAGLGLFTRSEFSFTPEFNQSSVQANYLNRISKADKGQLNVNQLGAVFFTPVYRRSDQDTKQGLVSMVYGIGYNRNSNFYMESHFAGANNSTSIADYFAELGGTSSPNNLASGTPERIAYDNYLISYDDVAGNYYPETFADATHSNTQQRSEWRSGGVSEFNFAAAANIANQVYVGASISLTNIHYTSDAQYTESGLAREYLNDNLTGNNINYKLAFNQNQSTDGSGVSGRLGVIFRASPEFRLGATLQTPSWYVINDSYTEEVDNSATTRGSRDNRTYDFTYNLRTPLKASLGASYIIAGQALLSADIDFVDYASTHLSSNDGNDMSLFADNNATIRKTFTNAINYRVGLEYKLNALSLRGGYALNASPYKNDDNGAFDSEVYSAGLGYRTNKYSIDFGYQYIENDYTMRPYSLYAGNEPVAAFNQKRNNVFLTFGLRF